MLIVDEFTKTIFLHNPKCGGTFVKNSYLNHYPTYPELLHKVRDGYGKETNVHGAHIDINNLPRFVPDYREYRLLAFTRNPYNRFISAWRWSAASHPMIRNLNKRFGGDFEKICQHLLSLDYSEQDLILRNYKIPWLMPQANFIRDNIINLQYESLHDWNFLFNLYRLDGTGIKIKQDYTLGNKVKHMIEKLYYEDDRLFDSYSRL